MIQISILDALDKELDALLPADFHALANACEADPADSAPKLVLADWLAEQGEGELEFGLRWLAARHLSPYRHMAQYGDRKSWGFARWYDDGHVSSKLPKEFRYLLGDSAYEANSLIGSIARFAKKLIAYKAEKQAELDAEFSLVMQPIPEPATKTDAVLARLGEEITVDPDTDDESEDDETHDQGDPIAKTPVETISFAEAL